MEKICPRCIDEYGSEQEKCARCGARLIRVNEFKIKALWPHCKKCHTALFEKAVKCDHCGQSLYLIPFSPRISAFIMGLAAIAGAGFLLARMGTSRDVMNWGSFLFGAIVWGIFHKQYHVIQKQGDVAWNKISQPSKFNFRKQTRDQKK